MQGHGRVTGPVGHLENGHFVPELALLLGGEAQLVNDLDRNISASLPVFSWGQGAGKAKDQRSEPPGSFYHSMGTQMELSKDVRGLQGFSEEFSV